MYHISRGGLRHLPDLLDRRKHHHHQPPPPKKTQTPTHLHFRNPPAGRARAYKVRDGAHAKGERQGSAPVHDPLERPVGVGGWVRACVREIAAFKQRCRNRARVCATCAWWVDWVLHACARAQHRTFSHSHNTRPRNEAVTLPFGLPSVTHSTRKKTKCYYTSKQLYIPRMYAPYDMHIAENEKYSLRRSPHQACSPASEYKIASKGMRGRRAVKKKKGLRVRPSVKEATPRSHPQTHPKLVSVPPRWLHRSIAHMWRWAAVQFILDVLADPERKSTVMPAIAASTPTRMIRSGTFVFVRATANDDRHTDRETDGRTDRKTFRCMHTQACMTNGTNGEEVQSQVRGSREGGRKHGGGGGVTRHAILVGGFLGPHRPNESMLQYRCWTRRRAEWETDACTHSVQ